LENEMNLSIDHYIYTGYKGGNRNIDCDICGHRKPSRYLNKHTALSASRTMHVQILYIFIYTAKALSKHVISIHY